MTTMTPGQGHPDLGALGGTVMTVLKQAGYQQGSTRASGFLLHPAFPSECTGTAVVLHYLDWDNDTDPRAAAQAADQALTLWAATLRANRMTVTETWRADSLRSGLIITR